MIAEGGPGVPRGGTIGKNDIDGMGFELREQVASRAGPHDEFHVCAADEGPQKLKLEIARQGGECPDPQDLTVGAGPAFEGAQQLVSSRNTVSA